jgi:hypothetical protein
MSIRAGAGRDPALIVDITATQFGPRQPDVKLARPDARSYRAMHTGERVEDAVRSVQATGALPDFGRRWWAAGDSGMTSPDQHPRIAADFDGPGGRA